MNPHFYAELSRFNDAELERAATAHRRLTTSARPAARESKPRAPRARRLAFARIRPATR